MLKQYVAASGFGIGIGAVCTGITYIVCTLVDKLYNDKINKAYNAGFKDACDILDKKLDEILEN